MRLPVGVMAALLLAPLAPAHVAAEESHEQKLNRVVTEQGFKMLRAARLCTPAMGAAWYRLQRSRLELMLLQAEWRGPAAATARWEREIDGAKPAGSFSVAVCGEAVETFARDLQVTIDQEEARAAEWCRKNGRGC